MAILDVIGCTHLASFGIILPKQLNYFTFYSCWLQILHVRTNTSLLVNWSITWRYCEVEITVTFVERYSFLRNDVAWGLMKCWCGGVAAAGKALAATRRRTMPLYPVPRANLLYFRALLYSRSQPQKLKRRCGWPTLPAVIVQVGRMLTDSR